MPATAPRQAPTAGGAPAGAGGQGRGQQDKGIIGSLISQLPAMMCASTASVRPASS